MMLAIDPNRAKILKKFIKEEWLNKLLQFAKFDSLSQKTSKMVNNKTRTARLEVCLNAFFFKKRPKSKHTKEEQAKKISGIKKIL